MISIRACLQLRMCGTRHSEAVENRGLLHRKLIYMLYKEMSGVLERNPPIMKSSAFSPLRGSIRRHLDPPPGVIAA